VVAKDVMAGINVMMRLECSCGKRAIGMGIFKLQTEVTEQCKRR
jgi:hypothetical protein